MNAVLLRSEPFLRLAPLAALLAGVFAWMLVFPDAPGYDSPTWKADPTALYRTLVMASFAALIGFTTFVPAGRRLQAFERTLPIPARGVVATRALATAIGLALPFAAALLALVLRGQPDASGQPLVLVALSLPFVIGATVLFGFAVFPKHAALEGARLFAVLAGMAILLLLPTVSFPLWIAPAYAALALSLLALLKSPASYLTPPRLSRSVSARRTKPGMSFGLDPLRWTLLRSTVLRAQSLMFLFALVWLVVLGLGLNAFFLWIFVHILSMQVRIGLGVLRGLGSLPISRERVLRYASLPSLLCLVVVFGTRAFVNPEYRPFSGLHPGVELDRSTERTLEGRGEYGPQLLVPPRLWKLHASDEPFVVQAPWGETHTPTPHPLFSSAPLAAVNPYSVGNDSTVQFLSWQISRALAESGGPPMDADGVRERFFGEYHPESPAGKVRWETDHSFRAVIHAGQPAGVQAVGGLALLAILAWALGCAWALRPNLPGIGVRTWRRRRWRRLILLLAGLALLCAVTFIDIKDGALLPVLLASFLSQIDALVGGSLVGWIVLDLALAALAYLAFVRRVQRIDPPVTRNGWTGRPFSAF